MIERFAGDTGKRLLVDALQAQRIVGGDSNLAKELADSVELIDVKTGQTIIQQDGEDNDLYFIITGAFDIVVNATRIRQRGPGDSVGEMAAVEPIQRRSATVTAAEDSLVAKLTEAQLTDLASRYPDIWRRMAKELAKRLLERNRFVNAKRDKIRVFVISSAEAIPVARLLQDQFARDPFLTVPWNQGVFKVASYTLDDIERELDQCDFAIAIAHGDDSTTSRGTEWPAPRDNVIFELGLFMGRLGRKRAILMEPRGEGVKLPSDMAGITTIPYVYDPKADTEAKFGPACNALRNHIMSLGPVA
ncbi:Pycsar phage resistance system effector protein PycTIR [Burkholderia cenocepacia]|uniref:Cyclic nucleotide-binding protein n=1 Tax=Burkholderia cenocepacia TaxID=95486 RepID=A0A1V2W6T5_9BURK|nr:Pycsar phage resistance system effector protein PycTIR [Burkholderia cenocepacia]MBR8252103.1 nucleotide-binding protein [Burkholderia cenocepacia]MBR8287724.1 nucleotide-binding protein [Burkholderia cenocepacia]MBR8496428.1 nucleotide-binding protein [Burkholderia cenocepacia]ONJ11579.1 cyclic nucleotide-binding protein [Burkholderia cenocepacia]ONJ28334.1 cyclic nucleotide-binding protein [Burkholderia cenocepacia]